MPSAKELRDELRALRKETKKPVSRMKKTDVLAELETLRGTRETVAPVASVGGAKPKMMVSKVEDVKRSKEVGFPMKPSEAAPKKKEKAMASGQEAAPKKKSKLDRLMAMMDQMSDTDEDA
jgi:hypothetical protein